MAQTFPDSSKQGGSSSQQNDQFGLLGLLPAIRRTDPWDLLNMELTTMGLDLNSTEYQYKTFASPWADEPLRSDEPESIVDLPACYINKEAPELQANHYAKFEDRTLFYIFYNMPRDEAQLFAANELGKRDWRFHKEIKMWMKRSKILAMTPTYEFGNFSVLDPVTLEVGCKEDFLLYYETLEKRPRLPAQL